MRYYDLEVNGKIKGSYATSQPRMNLVLLDDAPENSKWDTINKKWIPDQEVIETIQANQKIDQDIVLAKDTIKSIRYDIDKTKDIDGLKNIVLKLAEQVSILAEKL